MRNLKLVLEYDGSSFFGFQKQPRHPTIQEAFESALSKLLNRKTKIQAASGRTDTGVHAEYQIVNFKTPNPMPVSQVQKGLNALLPRAIAVKEIKEVPFDFHARYHVRSKVYEYRIWNAPVRSPLKPRSVHIPYPLDIPKMKKGIAILKGRHDFRSFASSRGTSYPDSSTVRTVYRFQLIRKGHLLIFRIEADGFLYHMVRNLMGALIELGKGKITLAGLHHILKAKDRRLAASTAPASGLTLVNVRY